MFRAVLRIRRSDVDDFLERSRVQPGELAHLYPPDHEEVRRMTG